MKTFNTRSTGLSVYRTTSFRGIEVVKTSEISEDPPWLGVSRLYKTSFKFQVYLFSKKITYNEHRLQHLLRQPIFWAC